MRSRENKTCLGCARELRVAMGLILFVGSFSEPGWGYSGGLGSRQVPYIIANAADLIELGRKPHDYDKHFILEDDIDLLGHTFDRAVIAALDEPIIWRHDDAFSGSVNGGGHVIRNLSISGIHNLGLFGALHPSAQIHGLGVVDANIIASGKNVGMLAGYSEGQIYSSYCTGVVSGAQDVGGLVGSNGGLVVNSYSSGQVSGVDSVGGLIGNGGACTVVDSYSTCLVQFLSEDPFPFLGGLMGGMGSVLASFWDVQTSGILRGWPGTGLNTEEMQDINTYLDAGWDFRGESVYGCQETWSMPEAGGYPILNIFHNLEPNRPAGCASALGRCTLPLDPKQVMWDSSAVFVPSWRSVALTAIAQNLEVYPENVPNVKDLVITISGKVDILDPNNFFSLDARNPLVCQALDDSGDIVELRHPVSPIEPIHTWTLPSRQTRSFELQLPLALGEPVPTSVLQLDFFVYALYGQPLVTFDLPLAAVGPVDWVELVPGFRVRVTAADYQDGECTYRIFEEISPGRAHFSMTLFDDLEPMMHRPFQYWDYMYTVNLIGAQGNPEWLSGSRAGSSYTTRDKFAHNTISAVWGNCTGEEVIRYTIAVKPKKFLIPLTLLDIPIGDF